MARGELSVRGFGRVDFVLAAVGAFWGINTGIIKLAMKEILPLAFNGLRFPMAALLILLVMGLSGEDFRIERRDVWRIALLGLVGNTFYQILFMYAINYSTAGNTSLMVATVPISVGIIGRLAGHERISRYGWLGTLLSFAGIALVVGGSGQGLSLSGSTIKGDLIALVATQAWAAYTLFSKPLIRKYSAIKVTAYAMVAGSVPLVVFSWPQIAAQDWGRVSPLGWSEIIVSAGLALVAGYILWSWGIGKLGSHRTALYSNLSPILAYVTGWVLIGERLTAAVGVGAILALAGLYVATLQTPSPGGAMEKAPSVTVGLRERQTSLSTASRD